jgi:DNA invertase Pin-like site-specific DNA recombinase
MSGMPVGHARVSTQDALKKAGCERIFTDTVSGAKWTAQERVGLSETLEFMRPGDTLVAWKLDRLGRSLKHLIETWNVYITNVAPEQLTAEQVGRVYRLR